jgi:hypothetical protein
MISELPAIPFFISRSVPMYANEERPNELNVSFIPGRTCSKGFVEFCWQLLIIVIWKKD